MSKDKEKTKLQDNPTPAPPEPPIPLPVIKPINYKAVEYLGWLMSDTQNLRNWASQLFASDVDLNSERVMETKEAALSVLAEVEDDVANIKNYLGEYIPPNKLK